MVQVPGMKPSDENFWHHPQIIFFKRKLKKLQVGVTFLWTRIEFWGSDTFLKKIFSFGQNSNKNRKEFFVQFGQVALTLKFSSLFEVVRKFSKSV